MIYRFRDILTDTVNFFSFSFFCLFYDLNTVNTIDLVLFFLSFSFYFLFGRVGNEYRFDLPFVQFVVSYVSRNYRVY